MRATSLALVLPLALTGCVTPAIPATSAADVDVIVIAEDIAYEPTTIHIPAGETITLELRNDGGIVHDLVLEDGWETGPVDPGTSFVGALGPLTGSTTAWCSIPGHEAAGMVLDIEVTSP